jgi:hypothetical protein
LEPWKYPFHIFQFGISTLGHDLRRSLMNPSSRYGKTFRIIF